MNEPKIIVNRKELGYCPIPEFLTQIYYEKQQRKRGIFKRMIALFITNKCIK